MSIPPTAELTPGSLFLCLGSFAVLTAVFALSAARGMPAFRRALGLWAAAMLGIAATAAGFLSRPLLPELLASTLPYLAAFCAAALLGACAAALPGGHTRDALRGGWLVLLASAALLLLVLVLRPPRPLLVSWCALSLGLICLNTALAFVPQLRERPRAVPELWLVASLLIVALTFLARAMPGALGLWADMAPRWLPREHPMLVVTLVFVASGSLAFFSMLHERQRLALQHSFQRDSLTGLFTRGVFFEKAQAVLRRSGADDVFAVVMVDLDHFKRINDSYGHLVGDKVIAHAARLLQAHSRINDLAGRYGGEEFSLLLPHCDAEQARRFAQRVLRSVEQPVSLRDGRSLQFSFSVGFLAFRRGAEEPVLEQLLDRADQALLQAKAQGRNRAVEAASTAHVVPRLG